MYVRTLSLFVLGLVTIASATTCYDQQGNVDPDLIACGLKGGCCRAGDFCYSNGLCKGSNDSTSNYNLYYDGCTTPDWSSPGCMSGCLKITPGANGVQPCPGGDSQNSYYCCAGFNLNCNCSDPSLVVKALVGSVVTSLPYSTASSTASSLTSFSATTSQSSSVTSAISTTLAFTSATASPQTEKHGVSTGLIVGIVVGILIGIVAIVTAIWILIRRRSKLANRTVPADSTYDTHNSLETPKVAEIDSNKFYEAYSSPRPGKRFPTTAVELPHSPH